MALPPQAIAVLRAARERWLAEAVARTPDARPLIVASATGRILHPASYYDAFVAVCQTAGLPHIPLHDLRHTYATLSMEAGANPRAVQAQLGHTRPNMTFAYTHATPEGQAKAAQAFGESVTRKAE